MIFRPGSRTGPGRVEFAVTTDDLAAPERRFALRAELLPDVEVDEIDGGGDLPLGESGRRRFRVTCRRIGNVGRPAPSKLRAEAPLEARFVAPSSRHVGEGDLIEDVRDVEVTIPASDREGNHEGTLTLLWDGEVEPWRQPVRWRVAPHIRVSPPGLILATGVAEEERRVLVRSSDRPFRIVEVSGPALREPPELPEGSGLVHVLRLIFDPSRIADGKAADVTITTDHPDQPTVLLSVVKVGANSGTIE